ncbi:MAG: tripartite tricarboxylate transporter TctB family protein [Spirochaetales bacterium]|nr:tripartite tricarboxylate transporter TctB family protein [Spirochaetales bacterium]
MKESNMPKADFATSIFLIVFGGAILYFSIKMPRFAERHVSPYSAPGLVPGLLGIIIGSLGIILLVRSIIRKGYKLNLNSKTLKTFFTDQTTIRILYSIVVSVAFWVLLGRIPFIVVTALYVIAFIIIFEYKRNERLCTQWKTLLSAVIVGVLTSVIVTYTFQYLFLVNLP